LRNQVIWAEMARRKLRFHPHEDWRDLRLWGLFLWGDVSRKLKTGELLAPGYTRENRVVWVYPSEEAYHKHIEPLLDLSLATLEKMAGW